MEETLLKTQVEDMLNISARKRKLTETNEINLKLDWVDVNMEVKSTQKVTSNFIFITRKSLRILVEQPAVGKRLQLLELPVVGKPHY